ncbi:ComF family protein [Vagococcus lutrae]|uniref:ComF family protein n=1 Tax=Vagococcus lutrae TaxID=81947 RepID=A0AAE9XE23_9ENTE|nr:ComF family protein [Vagococcus lutrae]WCG22457.1 ComF family protein [Vagococcus lutrae]
MKCLLCQRDYQPALSLTSLLSFQPLFKETICPNCYLQFESISDVKTAHCQTCLKKLTSHELDVCGECQQWAEKYPNITYQHHALFYYNQIAKEWLHRYKFLRDYRFRTTFSKMLHAFYTKHSDYIFVPIPVSTKRLEERGFNQVTAMLESALIPYHVALTKSQDTLRQSQRKRTERIEMVQPFQLNKEVCIKTNKLMIVDDIYTTGSTMYHALDVFSQVGITKLEGFTIFR